MSTTAALLVEAERYLIEKDIDRAAELCERARHLDGGRSPLPGVCLARIALVLGRTDDAIALLDSTIAAHPTCAEAFAIRGVAEDANGRGEASIPFQKRAIALNPSCGIAHFNLGRAHAQVARWHEARECFERATELLPASSEMSCALGVACFRSGDPARAVQVLGVALQRDPSHLDTLLTLVDVLVEIDQTPLANQLLDNAAARFPAMALLHSKRAALALRRQDVAVARTEAARACELAPTDQEAWLFAALLEIIMLRFGAAEQRLQAVLEHAPENWRAHYALGVVYDALRATDAAGKAYRKAIDCNPAAWQPLNNLATLLLEQGTPVALREARSLYERALGSGAGPHLGHVHYNLALTLTKFGDLAGGHRHALQAATLSSSDDALASASHRLAHMCTERGAGST